MTIKRRKGGQTGSRPGRAQPGMPVAPATSGSAPLADAWTEAEEERAAILEYEAELDRKTAEGQVRAWRYGPRWLLNFSK